MTRIIHKIIFSLLFLTILTTNAQTSLSLRSLLTNIAKERQETIAYKQIRTFSFSQQPLISHGNFYFIPPHYLEQRVLSPRKQRLLIKDDMLYIISPEKAIHAVKLASYPKIWLLTMTLRALLMNQHAFLQHYYKTKIQGNKRRWQLHLTPRNEKLIKNVIVYGKLAKINTIVIDYLSNDTLTLNLRYNKSK